MLLGYEQVMEMLHRSFMIPMRRQGVTQESQEPPIKPGALLFEVRIMDPNRVHEDGLGGFGAAIVFDCITQAGVKPSFRLSTFTSAPAAISISGTA